MKCLFFSPASLPRFDSEAAASPFSGIRMWEESSTFACSCFCGRTFDGLEKFGAHIRFQLYAKLCEYVPNPPGHGGLCLCHLVQLQSPASRQRLRVVGGLVSDFQDVSGWGTPQGIHMWCDGWAMVLEAFEAFEACEGFDFLPKLRSLPCDWWISLVRRQHTCGSLCESQLKQR